MPLRDLVAGREPHAALAADDAGVFITHYGLDRPANFEGRWHLIAAGELEDPARLDAARTALLRIRGTRVPPGRDDKILTSWNALAIKGLAQAAGALDRPEFATAAGEALCLAPVRAQVLAHVWPLLGRELRIVASGLGPRLPFLAGICVGIEAARS